MNAFSILDRSPDNYPVGHHENVSECFPSPVVAFVGPEPS